MNSSNIVVVLTARQISLMTGLPHVEILGYCKRGYIPSFKVGKSWACFRHDFENWAKEKNIKYTELDQNQNKAEFAPVDLNDDFLDEAKKEKLLVSTPETILIENK